MQCIKVELIYTLTLTPLELEDLIWATIIASEGIENPQTHRVRELYEALKQIKE
jgi:hypothetical protein